MDKTLCIGGPLHGTWSWQRPEQVPQGYLEYRFHRKIFFCHALLFYRDCVELLFGQTILPPGFPPLISEEEWGIAADYWRDQGEDDMAQLLDGIAADLFEDDSSSSSESSSSSVSSSGPPDWDEP